MKKSLLFILLLAAVVSYGVFSTSTAEKATSDVAKAKAAVDKRTKKAAKAIGYAEWRNERTKNVYTGVVDPQDYHKAIQYANQLKNQTSNKTDGVVGLEWVSRGPDSQGGRTRALLFDNTDPNLVYTGGVSGGLYRSTDLARNWERIASYEGKNASIMSLAQTLNGTILVGTGEALAGNLPDGSFFRASFAGDGIYKSNNGGDTWEKIAVTNVNSISEGTSGTTIPTFSGEWSSVRALATHPTKSNIFMAGNNNGVRISLDADAPQPTFFNAVGVTSNVSDVLFTSDGKEAWAAADGRVFRSTDEANNFLNFVATPIPGTGAADRTQLAISTVDDSGNFIVYASITDAPGCLLGIWKSEDKGISWTQIAFVGGSDPFAQPTAGSMASCQGWYDHCLAVNPVDKDKIYIGGITFYTWGAGSGGLKRADQIDSEGAGVLEPNYIHADKHGIRFSPHDPTGNIMLIGGDGGVNRCLNANSGFPDNMVYTENNKSYITLQSYSVGSGKYGEVVTGAQDNGSQYVDYKGISPRAAKEISGGDGIAGAEISNLSPDILFSGSQFGNPLRSLNNGESSTSFLDSNIDPGACGAMTCVVTTGSNPCPRQGEGQRFIYTFYLMETHDRLVPKNDLFVYARDEEILLPNGGVQTIRDTIPSSITSDDLKEMIQSEMIPGLDLNGLGLDYSLNATMFPGDTVEFENKFDAKYFIPSLCGSNFFVCTNPLQEGTAPRFSSVTIPLQSGINRMSASYDGDLLAATSGSRVIIMQGWDAYDPDTNPGSVTNVNVNLSSIGANSLSGVWVNKSNKDHVLVSEDGYGSTSKVFVSFNATSSSPTFANIHNNLPEAPIYACVIDKANPDRYIVGTEIGLWATNDGGVTWHEENDGMGGRYPIFAVRQHWMNNFDCDVLSVGSFGSGMYTSTSFMDCDQKDNLIWGRPAKTGTSINDVLVEVNHIAIYPNPVANIAKIAFDLNMASDVTIKIVDLTGKIVSQKTVNGLSEGSQTLNFDVSNLAASSYLVAVSAGNSKFSSRMFIKK